MGDKRNDPTQNPKPAAKPDAKPAARPDVKPAAKPDAKPEPKPGAKPEPKPGAKPDAKPGAKPDAMPGAKPEGKPGAKPDAKPGAKQNARIDPKTVNKTGGKKQKEKKEKKLTSKGNEYATGVDGKWGWFVVFNSFICNMIVDGMQYTFANFLEPIALTFNINISSASLIGSLLSGFYNFSGPIGSALGNKFGFRMVVITGSIVSAVGLASSCFVPSFEFLYFLYGILGGLGFGMIYMASVIMTTMYFEKYRALAVSLSVCGTGVGTFVFSPMGTFFVNNWGWRHALLVEGGVILVCILCSLSFKPVKIIDVVPIQSLAGSITSLDTRRGSMYYASEKRRTLPNAAYPTFMEALDEDPSTSKTSRAPSMNLRRLYSVLEGYEEKEQKKKNCCRTCCFNCWHCRCKEESLSLGDRPMYRDDIFYDSSISTLKPYTSTDRLEYTLKVTRVPDAQEFEEHKEKKCCTCHQAFLRALVTMTGINLLKEKVFIFLVISSFFYTMSLYIPYVFVRKLAIENSIPDRQAVWLLSAIGISNTAGRLISGIMKNFINMNAALFVFGCLVVSGLSVLIIVVHINLVTLAVYSCFFGLFTAPFISLRPVIIVDFLGLEKLTNAFGLVLLGQGIASVAGPPIAGVINDSWGKCSFTIYFSAILMLIASGMLLLSTMFK